MRSDRVRSLRIPCVRFGVRFGVGFALFLGSIFLAACGEVQTGGQIDTTENPLQGDPQGALSTNIVLGDASEDDDLEDNFSTRDEEDNDFSKAAPAVGHANKSIHDVTCKTTVYYSPNGGAEKALIGIVGGAEKEIRVAIFTLTNRRIVDALVAAKKRGVVVSVKADREQSTTPLQKKAIAKLEEAGIPVEISKQKRLLHHKFAVVDDTQVITGSFNWTTSADRRNRENLVILHCPDLAKNFSEEWASILPDAP